MKIDRLIGIIIVLLQKEKVTAPYLAEKFEVSRRTINRDIEDICKAGIPIITMQGSNGGISITDGYKIDKTLFTDDELQAIFSGLCSLGSVTEDAKYQNIIDKFSATKDTLYAANNILIDLSSHYKSSLAPKISQIQKAITQSKEIEFTYCNSRGTSKLILNPYLIVFQWASWYAFGYNHEKCEFRMFKLNRLWELHTTERTFQIQDIPEEKCNFNSHFTDDIQVTIVFDDCMKYRIIEEYGINCYTELDDGRLQFEFPFTNKDFLLSWVLSFGENAELLEPKELRVELKEKLEKSLKKYL